VAEPSRHERRQEHVRIEDDNHEMREKTSSSVKIP
jgi:hypothetical protein